MFLPILSSISIILNQYSVPLLHLHQPSPWQAHFPSTIVLVPFSKVFSILVANFLQKTSLLFSSIAFGYLIFPWEMILYLISERDSSESVLFLLTHFTQHDPLQIHPHCSKKTLSFLMVWPQPLNKKNPWCVCASVNVGVFPRSWIGEVNVNISIQTINPILLKHHLTWLEKKVHGISTLNPLLSRWKAMPGGIWWLAQWYIVIN